MPHMRTFSNSTSKILCSLPADMSLSKINSATTKLKTKLILIYLIVFGFRFTHGDEEADAVFRFPEYGYKETGKNEITYREFEVSCDQSPQCETTAGVDRIKCTRQCISPSCYHEIYAFDELEEGEIDVRLNSFKGCFIQDYRAQTSLT